jgi:5-methylcytosine-specific restriction endonuclease McrA
MASQRRKLLNSANFTCRYCGNNKLGKHQKSVDHVIPKSRGGSNSFNNLVMACTTCNWSKSSQLLNVWFPQQPFYSVERHKRILQKIGRYDLVKTL